MGELVNWHAIDTAGRRWYPYIMTDLEGKHRVLMHHEGADTDMGDLYMDELVEWYGPLILIPNKKVEN